MTRFNTEVDLASWLSSLEEDYEGYASELFNTGGVRSVTMLAVADKAALCALGVLPIHATNIKARAAGQRQLLTAVEWLRQAVPPLNRRTSERASKSKTRARHPKTFEELRPWSGFETGVAETLAHLSSEYPQPCYERLVWNVTQAETDTGQRVTAADKAEVRGVLMFNALQYINQLASSLDLEFEYQGNGSGRALSYTDIVLRRRGVSDRNNQSRLILGVIQVKGSWQLELPDDTDLVSAQDNPEMLKIFLPALQQAYGDAVMDEAPLLILTTYDLTYFLLRDTSDPKQKHLLVSKPVPFSGSQAVPFLVAWMHALFVAQKLWDGKVKDQLRRADVPTTPVGGYVRPSDSISAHPVFALNAQDPGGFHVLGIRQQPSRLDKNEVESSDEIFDTASGTSAVGVPTSSGSDGSDNSLDSVPELSYDVLGFTSHCLASSRNTRVVEGAWLHPQGSRCKAAVKVFNSYDPDALRCFQYELDAYQRLGHLQGTTIAKLLTFGRLPHTGARVLVLQFGEPVPNTTECADKAKLAVQKLHGAGVSHGDIRPDNLLLYGDAVVLCDLETCKFEPTNEDFQADGQALDACWAEQVPGV